MRALNKAAQQPWSLPIFCVLLLAAPAAGAPQESPAMNDPRIAEAVALMDDFARRTGLASAQASRRYLWTDAFAVCNFIGLARASGERRHLDLALKLVDAVHRQLGRHRRDDGRSGWLSGLEGEEALRHPTRGGLRIGKPLPERGAGEPLERELEWQRDGQYFHYLSKWMHALDQLARATREPRFNAWARELDVVAADAFFSRPAAPWEAPRMAWKMSIDLSRPLVASMGQHDPLDGYITSMQLHATMAGLGGRGGDAALEEATAGYALLARQGDWATADPLGIGGLLIDAYRVQQLAAQGTAVEARLLERLVDAALAGLEHYARSGELRQPAQQRLAFRELGLAIGLHAVERLLQQAEEPGLRGRLQPLRRYLPLREQIEAFWRDSENRRVASWEEHRDINTVMLATALAPDGFLRLPPLTGK
jgi:hypothetical protein